MNQSVPMCAASFEETGEPASKLGMWLFLASEVMFFAGLIAAFVVLRFTHPAWPGPEGHLNKWLGTANTFILLCSSWTVVMALADFQAGRQRSGRLYLLWTIVLGSAFLVIKGFEYSAKLPHGILPSTNIFWSCYYTLTGFHGLHVLGGIIANLWLFFRAMQGRMGPSNAYKVELAGLYWHFVDIVWLFLFPMLYLL
ncbi:MAG: cytochrome c oxidase subunit 3 [Candidatus Omnitrophica bacterium]|nr:cytochrome c oxidase subunit 3 [Candidatus Omnitrophota bacterium]